MQVEFKWISLVFGLAVNVIKVTIQLIIIICKANLNNTLQLGFNDR